jgi:hypothetical protein
METIKKYMNILAFKFAHSFNQKFWALGFCVIHILHEICGEKWQVFCNQAVGPASLSPIRCKWIPAENTLLIELTAQLKNSNFLCRMFIVLLIR